MQYNYAHIEDNPTAIETLRLLMKDFKEYKEVAVSCDLREGIRSIIIQKPDLIFLDVELPGFTGFDFIKSLRESMKELPTIIMSTSHEKYALNAINEDVFYYLLKPIDPDELQKALHKFHEKKAKSHNEITIKTKDGYGFLSLSDIFLIKSSSNYTFFYTLDFDKKLVSKTMKEFEPYLNDQFLRVHKSYIINIKFLHRLNTTKKKIQLLIPELTENNNQNLMGISENILDKNILELPIGEVYLERVKTAILYNKII